LFSKPPNSSRIRLPRLGDAFDDRSGDKVADERIAQRFHGLAQPRIKPAYGERAHHHRHAKQAEPK
jgi:hypothetical protein